MGRGPGKQKARGSVVNVRISDKLSEVLDEYIDDVVFRTRSDVVREAIQQFIDGRKRPKHAQSVEVFDAQ